MLMFSSIFINHFNKSNRNNVKLFISTRNIFTNPKIGFVLSKNFININTSIAKSISYIISLSSSSYSSKNNSNQIRSFSSSEVEKDNSLKPGLKSKLTILWKNYGAIAICTYIGVYASTMTSVFFALDYDIFNAATFGLDPKLAVEKFCNLYEYFTSRTDLPAYIKQNPRVGTFAIAWVMTKFTEPVRLGVTVAVVPSIARLLGKVPAKLK